jgi:hypothetical protein
MRVSDKQKLRRDIKADDLFSTAIQALKQWGPHAQMWAYAPTGEVVVMQAVVVLVAEATRYREALVELLEEK